MKQVRKGISKPVVLFALAAILIAGAPTSTVQAKEWQAIAGAESSNRGKQALAFLSNELWIHTGDSIRWTFPTHERHSVTFLRPGQLRPPSYSPSAWGVEVGCPGTTPDGSSFDGSACVHSGILLLDPNTETTANAPTYSVQFPAAGNFRLACLAHVDMIGAVHVLNPSETLPHNQNFYNRQAHSERTLLLADASRLETRGAHEDEDRAQSEPTLLVMDASRMQGQDTSWNEDRTQSSDVAAGIGEVVTITGAGPQSASLMRFLRDTIVVRVGDTVEWTSLEPSINHTVTFGVEPADPRPPSANVMPTSDGARQAVIGSPADSVNSGFLSPSPQDRTGLAEALPGITRFRVTFTSPGTFDYICAIHDELGMKGTVIVHR
jgi:plastocyanin